MLVPRAALATPAQAAALVTPIDDGFMAAVNEMDGLYAAPQPAAARVATDSDDALMAREMYESQDDSLLLCASDLQHSAIYDNHIEMQSCIRAVADRITALASVIAGVERVAQKGSND